MPKIPNIPDHLQAVLQERMSHQIELAFDQNGDPLMTKNLGQEERQIVVCKKTGKIYGGKQGFYTLGYHDYLTDKERKEIWDWQAMNVEKNRFDNAEKVKWSDWKGEQFFDGDEFYVDLDTFFDGMVEAYGFNYDEWQDYLWAAKPEPIISAKEAYQVYESDMEGLSDEYEWPVKGEKELQDALDEFVEANKETIAYQPDYSTVLLISDQIEEFRKDHED